MKVYLYKQQTKPCKDCDIGTAKLLAFVKSKGDELEVRNINYDRSWQAEAAKLETKKRKLPIVVNGSKKINVEEDWSKLYE